MMDPISGLLKGGVSLKSNAESEAQASHRGGAVTGDFAPIFGQSAAQTTANSLLPIMLALAGAVVIVTMVKARK